MTKITPLMVKMLNGAVSNPSDQRSKRLKWPASGPIKMMYASAVR